MNGYGLAFLLWLAALVMAWESRDESILALMDERNRYKGAFEALAPAPGETHITHIIRNPPTIEEQIRKMIRNAGGC
jgi:hypothetical protein